MENRPAFTKKQKDWICYIIGEWYLEWKNKIAPSVHLLGIAKEELKKLLFGVDTKDKFDEK